MKRRGDLAMREWAPLVRASACHEGWQRLLETHEACIRRVIARMLHDADAREDAFVRVCDKLAECEYRALRAFAAQHSDDADPAPWLATIARHAAIDEHRHRHGRQRRSVPHGLSPLHREIYRLVWIEGATKESAYERLRGHEYVPADFAGFLREVTALTRQLRGGYRARPDPEQFTTELDDIVDDVTEVDRPAFDEAQRAAWGTLSPRTQAALWLRYVDDRPASAIATALGWTVDGVYNRLKRAREMLRTRVTGRTAGDGKACHAAEGSPDPLVAAVVRPGEAQ